MAKYMDGNGLSHFMTKVKAAIAATVTGVKGNAESTYRTGQVNITAANVGAVAKSGDTMTGNLTVGDAGTNVLPTCGYRIIDMRNVSSYSPNDLPPQVANYFFDQNGEMPTQDGKFYGVFSMKGWTGNYGAWQIAGIAQDSDSDGYRNSPLYVRGGNRSTWGPWRKLFDEKNKSTECQTTNPFAPGSLSGPYISKIDNAFYAADKRWDVSATLNGSAISAGNVAYWFNGDYESRYQVAKSGTCVITMDFANTTYFPGYPYGYILVSFYYNEAPASVSGRVYCNYQSQGVGWHDISFAPVSDSGTYSTVYRSAHQGYYNISQLEITVVASSSVVAGISQIEMHLDRPYSGRNPFLSKYAAETLYYNLTAPKFIGALQGNADTATNANGITQANRNSVANYLINALATGSSDPVDADYYVSQYVGGGTTTTTYHRRPMSALWNYIKGKFKATMLSSATNSSSEELAATPKAVKAAYDLANTASTTAGKAMSAATGALTFKVTYSVEDGAVTCYAHVYSAGEEVTENYEDECFDWSITLDGGTSWVVLGTGRDMPLTAMTAFGGNVKCDFTPPES